MWKLKDFGSSLENAFGSYSEPEILVREATCEEPWGPTNKQMEHLCELCDSEPEYSELMNMVWFRIIHEPQKSWRRVYKGLLILDFLVRNGPVRVIHDVVENIHYLEQIKLYNYIDSEGVDKTLNITHRASQIRLLVEDHEKLRSERKTMRQLQQRMQTDHNHFTVDNDKSLAIKTRSFINDVMEKVTNNHPTANKKSFYESSKKVFTSSYNQRRYKNTSNPTIYHDESDDKDNYGNDIVVVKSINSKQTEDNDEFGEFVGPTTTSHKVQSNGQQNSGDLLFDIFNDPPTSSIVSNTGNQFVPTAITLNSPGTIDDIFNAANHIKTTPQIDNIMSNPNDIFEHFAIGNTIADSSQISSSQQPSINNAPIVGTDPSAFQNPFIVPNNFISSFGQTNNVTKNSTASTQHPSNKLPTTINRSSGMNLDDLINKNMMF